MNLQTAINFKNKILDIGLIAVSFICLIAFTFQFTTVYLPVKFKKVTEITDRVTFYKQSYYDKKQILEFRLGKHLFRLPEGTSSFRKLSNYDLLNQIVTVDFIQKKSSSIIPHTLISLYWNDKIIISKQEIENEIQKDTIMFFILSLISMLIIYNKLRSLFVFR